MAKTVKCAVCGSVIHTETGETKFSKDDIAFSIEKLKEENARLKSEIQILEEQLSGRHEKIEEDVPGEDEENGDDFFETIIG